jgi:hypothetical protein
MVSLGIDALMAAPTISTAESTVSSHSNNNEKENVGMKTRFWDSGRGVYKETNGKPAATRRKEDPPAADDKVSRDCD